MSNRSEMDTNKQRELDHILNSALDDLDDSSCDGDNSDESDDEQVNKVENVVDRGGHSVKENGTSAPTSDGNNALHKPVGNDSTSATSADTMTETPRPVFGPVPPPPKDSVASEEEEALEKMLNEMESLLSSTVSPSINDKDASKMTSKPPQTEEGKASSRDKESKKSTKSKAASKQHSSSTDSTGAAVDDTINKLLDQLSKPSNPTDNTDGMSPDDFQAFEAMSANFMKEMEDSFKTHVSPTNGPNTKGTESGHGFDADQSDEAMEHVLSGMMNQLLSKDLMYEPMKDICEKYPEWLAEHKQDLSDEEYQRYGNQYQYFQRIVAVYEHDPNNITRVTELMHAIQEYGQPPPELIQQLVPDLEFDEDGLPNIDMDGFGGAGGAGGLPFAMMGKHDENCCIS